MKMVAIYSPNGNAILAPEPNVEYLISKGWSKDKPGRKTSKKIVVEPEETVSQETK